MEIVYILSLYLSIKCFSNIVYDIFLLFGNYIEIDFLKIKLKNFEWYWKMKNKY